MALLKLKKHSGSFTDSERANLERKANTLSKRYDGRQAEIAAVEGEIALLKEERASVIGQVEKKLGITIKE